MKLSSLKKYAFIEGLAIDWGKDYTITKKNQEEFEITQEGNDYTISYSGSFIFSTIKYNSTKDEHYRFYNEERMPVKDVPGILGIAAVKTHQDGKVFIKSLSYDQDNPYFYELDEAYDEAFEGQYIINGFCYSLEAFKLFSLINNGQTYYMQRDQERVVIGSKLGQDGQIIKTLELSIADFKKFMQVFQQSDSDIDYFYQKCLTERPFPYQYLSREKSFMFADNTTLFKVTKGESHSLNLEGLHREVRQHVQEKFQNMVQWVKQNPYVQSAELKFGKNQPLITMTTQFKDMTASLLEARKIEYNPDNKDLKCDDVFFEIDDDLAELRTYDTDDKALSLLKDITGTEEYTTAIQKDGLFYFKKERHEFGSIIKQKDGENIYYGTSLGGAKFFCQGSIAQSLNVNTSYLVLRSSVNHESFSYYQVADETKINHALLMSMVDLSFYLKENPNPQFTSKWDRLTGNVTVTYVEDNDAFNSYIINLINLQDPKTWFTIKCLKEALGQSYNDNIELLLTMLHQSQGHDLEFELNDLNGRNVYDINGGGTLKPKSLDELESAYITKDKMITSEAFISQGAKPSILPHALLPSAVVLSAIFVSTGVIAMPVFSIALMTASALGALALQVAIYQNNTQNKGGMLQNPWVSHNTLAFGLALIAYLSLMTNPLAALIAVSTIMTLAPLASVMSQSLFAGNDADATTGNTQKLAA